MTGTVTTAISHYSFGGLRFAVKRGAALHHLHGDHLGSTSLTTDTAGAATASRAYYAYGAERSSSGTLQTDRTFTGQKRDATGLMQYNARYYDPALGTFVSPDSLVPDPGMVIDYNRFLYVRGNPLKFTDSTGHDPLGPAWVGAFREAHDGRYPNARDRRDRLFSLVYLGSMADGSWTENDWSKYSKNRRDYWTGEEPWEDSLPSGLSRFSHHVRRLASHYGLDETDSFVNAFGLVFAGIPYGYDVSILTPLLGVTYGNPLVSVLDMVFPADNWAEEKPLHEGEEGWDPLFLEPGDPNQAHHYAGLFYMGYWFTRIPATLTNWARDGIWGWNYPDTVLGDMAARHGHELRRGAYTMYELADRIFTSLSPQSGSY